MTSPATAASPLVDRLQMGILAPLKQRFVGREEVIDLIALAVTAGEHLFLFGPPGTAKSALIRAFAHAVHGRYFEYLLTRFSEPNELFGPLDLAKLRDGTVATVTTGMLPEAEFVFLDELFNANSAILNNLLTVLNERIYRRGAESYSLPLLSLFSASNHLPEEETLQALFDRFLLRCRVRPLTREAMPRLLLAGWELERGCNGAGPIAPALQATEFAELRREVLQVDLTPILETYVNTIFQIRDLGVDLSDRRAVKILKLVAASAVLCGRALAAPSDLWVFRHVWDREEQIDPLDALLRDILRQQDTTTTMHPRAALPEQVDAEEVARQLAAIEREISQATPSLTTLARCREQVARLADQAAWVSDAEQRHHLTELAARLTGQLQG